MSRRKRLVDEMSKVLNIVESEVKQINGRSVQRVIFSDDKIVYVNIHTGEVKPESTPDSYVNLISLYNASHRQSDHQNQILEELYQNRHESIIPDTIPDEAARIRKSAAEIDVFFLIVAGLLTFYFLFVDSTRFGWAALALTWMIPMTVVTYKSIHDNSEKTALGVCHLIFFNIISGILILQSDKWIRDPDLPKQKPTTGTGIAKAIVFTVLIFVAMAAGLVLVPFILALLHS